ncbi:MAG: DUF6788 family protein [Gammaproteobacteria bacterium]
MPESLADWERQRAGLLRQISHLRDFRRGSITTTGGTCGTQNCHCHEPHDPGHGPTFRLTYKLDGKTVTESFASPAALRKAQGEVAEYHQFRELSKKLLAVNEAICRLRPLPESEAESRSRQEKKRRKRSTRKSGTK